MGAPLKMSEIISMEGVEDDPQKKLLISLKTDNFDKFKLTLKRSLFAKSVDINHFYADPENGTLLDIACNSTHKAAHVKCLLKNGADANLLNPWHGAAPIHFAVSNSDFDTVKVLVEHKATDIRLPDTAGKTAFQLAASRKREDVIRLLQKRQADEIKRAKREILTRISTYEQIEDDGYKTDDDTGKQFKNEESLSSFLRQRNYEAFAAAANASNVRHADDDLGFTYLQYACKFGLVKFVKLLLDLNVDPNETVESHPETPITLAASHGYHEIVQLLIDTGIITYDLIWGENILHAIMHKFCYHQTCRETHNLKEFQGLLEDSNPQDYVKCLKLILDTVPDSQLAVDLPDRKGNTPLYYAILLDHRDMILLLLERGAYIGAQSGRGEVLIKLMKPATLKHFLDGGITYTAFGPILEKYSIITFNYSLLNRKWSQNSDEGLTPLTEIKPLVALSETPELRPLLKHPLLLVFLDFKWYIMRRFFFINLFFYTQFFVSLNVFLLWDLSHLAILWYYILVNNCILVSMKFIKFVTYSKANTCQFHTDAKNWIEITLTIIVYVILCGNIVSAKITAPLGAIAIFLSHVDVMLRFSSHPNINMFGLRMQMFRAVAWNTLLIIIAYFILIQAFALSFYELRKDTNSTDAYFHDISTTYFKTLIMSTGKYELKDLLVDDAYGIKHLIFIIFVFLIPIVLFNLMNATAVSDIHDLRKDAELVNIAARAKSIAQIEEIISDLFLFLDRLANGYNALLTRRRRRTMKLLFKLRDSYFAKYSATNGYYGHITYHPYEDFCSVTLHGSDKIFHILPYTEQTIQEMLSTEASKEEEVNKSHDKTAEVTREAGKNKKIPDFSLILIREKFKEITELLDQKSK